MIFAGIFAGRVKIPHIPTKNTPLSRKNLEADMILGAIMVAYVIGTFVGIAIGASR